ncbi:MAG: rod shape-determining protein RodA [Bacteroidales bacterium]|jgi:rod shape determining protein RodA|nr:rod shape-determining protein RodA [Bacteroidales bacterium]
MTLTAVKNSSKSYDIQLIVYYILLVTIGWFAIYASAYDKDAAFDVFTLHKPFGRQLIWIGVSLLEILILLLIDNKLIYSYAHYFYGFCLLIMVIVLFVAPEISGARAWIRIGAFSMQPVEFMKLATALSLAKFFSDSKTERQRQNIWLYASLLIGVAIILTFLQHDTGSALVFLSFIILFYREGLSTNFLIIGIMVAFIFIFTLLFNEIYTIGALLTVFLIFWYFQRKNKRKMLRNLYILIASVIFVFAVNILYNNIFQVHQKQRIDSILGKSSDPKGADFNLNQSLIAIGSGGFMGKGFQRSTQMQLNFVPEQSTDFIFCGIAETFGFVGCLVLVAIFMLLIIRIIVLSEKQRNPFVHYYGYAIAGLFFFHFAINIGMTIGILPIIGIPLPFISYGGTSILAFTAMLFIFIKLDNN